MQNTRVSVAIVILNYKNWEDTVACIQSVLHSTFTDYRIFVVDNASDNDSVKNIEKWLRGEFCVWLPSEDKLKRFIMPPVKQSVSYTLIHENDISQHSSDEDSGKVVLIQAQKNRGYAAGNNIALTYALNRDVFDYFWILNNDTVVREDTLSNLVAYARKRPETGIVGNTLLYYDQPDTIQAFGGAFCYLFATQKHLFAHRPYEPRQLAIFDQKRIDYIVGASMLVRAEVVRRIGMLDERYFIYFEEIDYALRVKRAGYRIAIAPDAIVYHKESASISKEDSTKSAFSDFYALRNRLLFTRKFFPYLLPTVYLGMLFSLMLRVIRKERQGVKNILFILKSYGNEMMEYADVQKSSISLSRLIKRLYQMAQYKGVL